MPNMQKLIDGPLREWTGPLTSDLVQSPGPFGLGHLPTRLKPDATVGSVCGFCGTGCQLAIHLKDGVAVNLSPGRTYPVNTGMACPKGWESLAPLDSDERGTSPMLRDDTGALRDVSWSEAVGEMVARLKDIQKRYGKESVAWLGTGQITVEEFALLGALGKFGMGIKHGDGNTRQCMATAVMAYKGSFGFDAPPYTYQDFEESDCLIFIGSNLCIAHPIMWQRVMQNKRNPDIIVIDPRRTETAMAATRHLAIHPKSDLILFYALANHIIESGKTDSNFVANHTNGFLEFAGFVKQFPISLAAKVTGLTENEVIWLSDKITSGKNISFWWTMGVNQSHQGTAVAQSIINLALLTGNIGRPGTGANSITGQCNAMGSRLFSNTTNLLGGHDFGCPESRRKVADIMDISEDLIPTDKSLAYNQILDAVDRGEIKALWIIATNPMHSWIQKDQLRNRLNKLELLVVQDMYRNTATVGMADIYLPAAGWGEKDGTFINSERRIGLTRKVAQAPGQALSDFYIFKLVADYWGCGQMFRKWEDPEDCFNTLKLLTAGQPCDFSGIGGYAHIEEQNGIQWPYPHAGNCESSQRRLFEDRKFFTEDGRARFCWHQPDNVPEKTDRDYPFILLTGRGSSSQWHTGTRTDKSDILRKLSPDKIYVEINTEDAAGLEITNNDSVHVRSRRGKLLARAIITPCVRPGNVFISMHFEETNKLTLAVFDPISFQPGFKFCAVNISKSNK